MGLVAPGCPAGRTALLRVRAADLRGPRGVPHPPRCVLAGSPLEPPPMIPPIDAIRLRAETAASPATLWAWLTEPEKLARWFTAASPLGAPGNPHLLDFGDGSAVEGTVRAVDAGRSFSHTWRWRDEPEASATLVSWTVEPLPGGRAAVVLVHDGWMEAGLPAAVRDEHATYWRGYLGALVDPLADAA